jgi:hypothetical protein
MTIHWTEEMDACLTEMRNRRASYQECSKKIGVYWQGCQRRGRALGLPSIVPPLNITKWTPRMEARLISLRAKGASWAEVGAALQLNDDVCRRRARRIGVDTSNPLWWTRNMDRRLIRLRSQGLSWNQIGKQMHLTLWSVRNRGRILGLVKHKTPSAVQPALDEVGCANPPNTAAASVAASVPLVSLQTGGSGANEPTRAAFLGEAA